MMDDAPGRLGREVAPIRSRAEDLRAHGRRPSQTPASKEQHRARLKEELGRLTSVGRPLPDQATLTHAVLAKVSEWSGLTGWRVSQARENLRQVLVRPHRLHAPRGRIVGVPRVLNSRPPVYRHNPGGRG
jgi:hypothetical protein